MNRQNIDTAIKHGIEAAYDFNTASSACYEARKLAQDSGLFAGLSRVDELSRKRIRPIQYQLDDGTLYIETRVPAPSAGIPDNTVAISVTADKITIYGALGNYNGKQIDALTTQGDAAPILKFIAAYAERGHLFSARAAKKLQVNQPRQKGRVRQVVTKLFK